MGYFITRHAGNAHAIALALPFSLFLSLSLSRSFYSIRLMFNYFHFPFFEPFGGLMPNSSKLEEKLEKGESAGN